MEQLNANDAQKYFDAIGEELLNPVALDIKIIDGDEEWQPEEGESVEVSITKIGATLSDTVYHFTDEAEESAITPNAVKPVKAPAQQSALKFETLTGEADGSTATVTTQHFSIYVIGETQPQNRLLVKFMEPGSDEPIDTMYVKQGDDMETVIHEPAYNPPAGTIFKGWTTVAGYTVEGLTPAEGETEAVNPAMTIDDVRTAVEDMLPAGTDGQEVIFYAMLFKQYKVTYLDPNGGSLNQDVKEFPYSATNTNPAVEYIIRTDYVPDDENHGFLGWHTDDKDKIASSNPAPTVDLKDGELYQVNTVLTIKGDVTFSADAPLGRWLVFNENGKGATYNAPQFVRSGDVTHKPCEDTDMVRLGYSFHGWYKDAACTAGNEFTFGGTLDAKTTIYAKWVANAEADYTIIIWKQNLAGGDGFDFEESITLRGNVGQNVSAVVPVGTGNDRYASVNGVNKQYTGFHLKEYDNPVKITPENNAVVNVYYDRNEYTLTFIDENATKKAVAYVYWGSVYNDAPIGNKVTSSSDIRTLEQASRKKTISGYDVSYTGSNNYAIKVGEDWYRITSNGYYVYNADSIISATLKTVSNGVVKTITRLYQQPIGDLFPIVGDNGATYPTGTRWNPQSTLTVDGTAVFTKGVVVSYIDTMPAGDMTFTYGTSTADLKTMVYWIEALNSEPSSPDKATTIRDGVVYEEYKTVKANYYRITVEDYIDIPGYEHSGADKDTEEVTLSGENTRQYINDNGDIATEVNFYFDRLHYAITYLDGAYADGNGNPMDEIKQGEWKSETNIAFGADVSGYEDYEPAAPAGFVFAGWYLDDTCTTKATFDKMPEGGMTVYAKWRQIQYRVFLHPNAGTRESDPSLTWGSASQAMNFRISYDGKVSIPTGLREGYEFYGWYLTPDFASGTQFNEDMRLNESLAAYYKTYAKTEITDVLDDWGNVTSDSPDPDNDGNPGWNSDTREYKVDENGNVTNRPIDRFWITQKLDLYAKWGRTLDNNANGIRVTYSLKDTKLNVEDTTTPTPVDATYYKPNTTANAAPGVAGPDGYKFDHWVMQEWNGTEYVDVSDSVIYAGAKFTVDAAKAKKETTTETVENPETHENEQVQRTTYTIRLRAAYAVDDTPNTIDVTFNAAGGTFTAAATTEIQAMLDAKSGATVVVAEDNSTITIKDLRINEAFKLLSADAVERNNGRGYRFNSWNTKADGTGDTFNATDNLGADPKEPFPNTLYAIWDEVFYVYHTATGEFQTVDVPKRAGGTVDRVALTTGYDAENNAFTNYYYGGFAVYAIGSANAEGLTFEKGDVKSGSIAPANYTKRSKIAKDANLWNAMDTGAVYVIREVDTKYLPAPKKIVIRDGYGDGNVTGSYVLTAVDINLYAEGGVQLSGTDTAGILAKTFKVSSRNGTSTSLTAADQFSLPTTAYLAVVNTGANNGEATRTFTSCRGYWKTYDGVVVYGVDRNVTETIVIE